MSDGGSLTTREKGGDIQKRQQTEDVETIEFFNLGNLGGRIKRSHPRSEVSPEGALVEFWPPCSYDPQLPPLLPLRPLRASSRFLEPATPLLRSSPATGACVSKFLRLPQLRRASQLPRLVSLRMRPLKAHRLSASMYQVRGASSQV